MVCAARETCESAVGASGIAEQFGVGAIVYRAEDGRAQPVVTGSAVGSRWWSVASDRQCVMRPAFVAVRASLVFVRGGRPR